MEGGGGETERRRHLLLMKTNSKLSVIMHQSPTKRERQTREKERLRERGGGRPREIDRQRYFTLETDSNHYIYQSPPKTDRQIIGR